MPDEPTTRRTWRYSLRALLVAMAGVALVMGWVHSAREQAAAKRAVAQANPSARLFYDYELDAERRVVKDAAPPGPDWLRAQLGVDYLAAIEGADLLYATDADLELLARLPHLRRLYLERAVDVTDAGLVQIARLSDLEFLVLDDVDQVTDGGLESLRRLKRLAYLRLDGRQITPAGIERLQSLLPDCRIELDRADEEQPLPA